MPHDNNSKIYIDNIKDTVVLESPIHGYGLFATHNIPKGTLLCCLSGQVVSLSHFEKLLKSQNFSKDMFVEKHHIDDKNILITPFRTKYSYINHSDTIEHLDEIQEGNKVYVYAKADIKKHEEILSRYNLSKHVDVLGGFKK